MSVIKFKIYIFFQIEVIADVEGVGQNYRDHHGMSRLSYTYKNYKESSINILKLLKAIPSYKTTPKGLNDYFILENIQRSHSKCQCIIHIYDNIPKLFPI